MYKLKKIGDKKLYGFIKNFDFCDINGSLQNGSKIKANIMIFWHSGPRKNKRRECKLTLIKPSNICDPVRMQIEWKEIATSSIVDKISQEKGTYSMIKMESSLKNEDDDKFKYKIGLARHEYIDAMLVLSGMKFSENKNMETYETLNKLCEEYIVPFIWDGPDGADQATLKQIFRPYQTELHKLFKKYSNIDEDSNGILLGIKAWNVFCYDIFNNYLKDGKPSQSDIMSSFQLAKGGHDLELTYKGFENALKNIAFKIYKKKPNAKYKTNIKYHEKLKKLLKWAKKLEKSGYQPTMSSVN